MRKLTPSARKASITVRSADRSLRVTAARLSSGMGRRMARPSGLMSVSARNRSSTRRSCVPAPSCARTAAAMSSAWPDSRPVQPPVAGKCASSSRQGCSGCGFRPACSRISVCCIKGKGSWLPPASAIRRSASSRLTSPSYRRAGSRTARSRSPCDIGGSRYCTALTACAKPGNRAQAPRYSERMVVTRYKPAGGCACQADSTSVSARASAGPSRRACWNSSSNWSISRQPGPRAASVGAYSSASAAGASAPKFKARRQGSAAPSSSASAPARRASAWATCHKGARRGQAMAVFQPGPARPCSSCASSPARTTELLPLPESPCTKTRRWRTRRSSRSSTACSRPKKIGHSSGSKGRRPG